MSMISIYCLPLIVFSLIIPIKSYLLSSNHVLLNRRIPTRNTFLNEATIVTDLEGDNTHLLRKNVELYDQQKYGTITSSDLVSLKSPSASSSSSSSSIYGTKPEVLAPAGGWPQLRAAVANGADACYFGLQEGFNARARASNFAIDELAEVMTYLHERGMKGYLVINILVFDEEMGKVRNDTLLCTPTHPLLHSLSSTLPLLHPLLSFSWSRWCARSRWRGWTL